MTYKHDEAVWNYISGLSHGIRPAPAYFYWTMESVSYVDKAENVLIIGYGTGTTTEAVLNINGVKKVTIIELNKGLINNLRKMDLFREMLDDPRVDLVIDDGRRYLLRTDDKFDLVFIDPLRSSTYYSNNLYSRQFFEIVKQHLSKGGIFMVWSDEYRVIPKTVMSVFDHVKGYETFTLASNYPLELNNDLRQSFLKAIPERARTLIPKWIAREAERAGDKEYFKKLVAAYPVNEDWKPVAEYYIGLRFKEKYLLDLSGSEHASAAAH